MNYLVPIQEDAAEDEVTAAQEYVHAMLNRPM